MLALEKKLIWQHCPKHNTAGIPPFHKRQRKYEL